MRIIVLVKAVRTELVFDDIANRSSYTINPYDLYALQHILDLKKENDFITCISMGHSGAKMVLEKCLALGADEAIWLYDVAFAGADTIATSYTLAFMLKKQKFDLIICGSKAVDGETAQVPAGVAERLGIRYISEAKLIKEIKEDHIILTRANEVYTEIVNVNMPALVAFNNFTTTMNTISMKNMRNASKKEIILLNASDIGVDMNYCGMMGSKTKVLHTNSNFSYQNKNTYFNDIDSFSEYIIHLIEKHE